MGGSTVDRNEIKTFYQTIYRVLMSCKTYLNEHVLMYSTRKSDTHVRKTISLKRLYPKRTGVNKRTKCRQRKNKKKTLEQ